MPLLITLAGAAIIGFAYRTYFTASHSKNRMSEQDTSSLVEETLIFHLPVTDAQVRPATKKIANQMWDKVQEVDYEGALAVAFAGLKKYPSSFELQSYLAFLLGDHSMNYPSPLKGKMIVRSKEIFQKLMDEIEDQPKKLQFFFRNEYYYRLGKYKDQYELGVERIAYEWNLNKDTLKDYRGYYSQGVGAANYARELLKQGKKSLALDYAQKALVAWAQYFTYRNTYYNAYVHYALALGILGYKQEMIRALKRSASLIGQDLNYVEFKEVIQFIEGVEKETAS